MVQRLLNMHFSFISVSLLYLLWILYHSGLIKHNYILESSAVKLISAPVEHIDSVFIEHFGSFGYLTSIVLFPVIAFIHLVVCPLPCLQLFQA